MKTYLKTLERMFKKHLARFLSIIFIVLISVGFVSGIGSAVDKINFSQSDYYKAQNVSDFIVKSTGDGFDADTVAKLKARYGEKNVNTGMSVDVDIPVGDETQLVRLYFFDDETATVNVRDVLETQTIAVPDGCDAVVSAEAADNKISGLPLGTEITIDFKDVLTQLAKQNDTSAPDFPPIIPDEAFQKTVVVGSTELSPLTFAKDGEPSYKNGEDVEIPDTIDAVNALVCVENILYLPMSLAEINVETPLFSTTYNLLPTGDLYIAIQNRELFNAFSKNYKTAIETEAKTLGEIVGKDARILTLYDNYSFSSLHAYGEKVTGIGLVLMVAFLLVTVLVVLSTMTRLLDEERAQVACLRTLGYPAWRIIFKYLLFAAIATGIGGVGSYFVGFGIARLLYVVFNYSYAMPPISSKVAVGFFLIVYFIVVVATLAATAISGARMTNEKPAVLLRPKVPKAGKKIFLERIPFLWKLLSFKYKSTTRNVLRYKSRFLMTVVATAFATALVLAGLGLLDLCLFQGIDSPTVMAVAVVVVVFAGLLTGVVIYTLTNINISERNRELATLMVLGYYDGEVAGYIYREIYIDTVIGIIVGLPCSLPLLSLLFKIMTVGSISLMSWFMWLLAPVMVIIFTAIVTLLLRHKIVKIDMNESLKAIE